MSVSRSLSVCVMPIKPSWLVFDGEDFTGRMHVLEVGSYPDLRAVGCDEGSASIRSLQPVGFVSFCPFTSLILLLLLSVVLQYCTFCYV